MQSFILRAMSLNFIPIFAAMHLVTERELPWDQRVHEASQDKIQAAINGPFIKLPNNKVKNWYPDTVKNVVEGKGSTIQRKKRIQHEMIAWKAGIKMDPSEYMKFNFGWTTGLGRLELPEFLSVKDYGNSALVVFRKNDFPWRLSKDVQHHLIWFRPPLVTPAAFKRLKSDPAYPNREFRNINGRKVAALIEYLNENDVYGWIGLPPPAVLPFRQSSELHPTEKDVWVTQSGVAVTRQEAAEAMRWVGRHTNRLIAKRFPPSRYETVWNRTNYRVRSILEPNHIHALVIPKNSPHSFFSQSLGSPKVEEYALHVRRRRYQRKSAKSYYPSNA
ncbi:hypothetical protein KEM48_008145 [Puccinia striiformis f. sp. tritici PST-130]|nr:hypothetical protein KEM48_008145 [Puccinia striiformis f. sp. tritici PST-130]